MPLEYVFGGIRIPRYVFSSIRIPTESVANASISAGCVFKPYVRKTDVAESSVPEEAVQ